MVPLTRHSVTTNLLLVDFQGIAVLHLQLNTDTDTQYVSNQPFFSNKAGETRGLTVSGVSVGWTRWPSNRKRTEASVLPWRSQKAVMSFSSLVLRLILKKTSLLLSVTLMLRCSFAPAWGISRPGCTGLPFSALSAIVVVLEWGSCSRFRGLWFERGSEVCSGFWVLVDVLSAFFQGTQKTTGEQALPRDSCGGWKEREEVGRRTGGAERRQNLPQHALCAKSPVTACLWILGGSESRG